MNHTVKNLATLDRMADEVAAMAYAANTTTDKVIAFLALAAKDRLTGLQVQNSSQPAHTMQIAQIEQEWAEGMPISTIAYRTGMTIAQVRKHIKSLGHTIQG